MKRICCFLLLMTAVALPAAAAEVNVASKITDVVVFTDRAQVTRKAAATVPAGVSHLVLPVEAFSVDPDAVTATVNGRGEILAVQYREVPVMEATQESVRSLESKIRKLQQDRRAKVDEKNVLDRQEAFLRAFIDFSKTQVPVELKTRMPGTEELGRTLSFLDDGFTRVYQKMRTADLAIAAIDDDIRQAERELNDLRQPGPSLQRRIEIQFDAAGPQKVQIAATYVARHAGWSPIYRAAVPADLSGVDLSLFSRIVQKTGENWQGVAMSVSNVVPLAGARLPDPGSWWLDVPRPMARVYRKSAVMAESAPMDADKMAQIEAVEEAAPAAYAEAERKSSDLAFEYAFKDAVTVDSGEGGETVLPVFTRRLAGDVYRYAVPRQSPLTYLVCEAAVDRELLSGPLNVYFSGRFVGKMMLEEKKPGAVFKLGLGADRQVVVKREKVTDHRKETFFGKIDRDSVVRELGYRIVAENLRDKPVSLRVIDSLPVSRTDRITVENVAITPAPAEKNLQDREGVMEWRLQLPAGEKVTVDERFTVIYPKDMVPGDL